MILDKELYRVPDERGRCLVNLHEHVEAETWVLQDCRLSGITVRCLDSCLGKSQSVDLMVTDNCLMLLS